jgi:hypothetical protein
VVELHFSLYDPLENESVSETCGALGFGFCFDENFDHNDPCHDPNHDGRMDSMDSHHGPCNNHAYFYFGSCKSL